MKLITPNEITCVCKSTLSFKEINLILCNLTIVFAYHVVQFSRTKFASLYQCVSSKQLIYYSMSFWVCQALFSRFFEPLWLSLSKFPDWLTVWVPIGPLWCAALRQLNYNTTPASFCQHLFYPFFDFFWKNCFFPFLCPFLLSLSFVIAIKIKVLYNKPCF